MADKFDPGGSWSFGPKESTSVRPSGLTWKHVVVGLIGLYIAGALILSAVSGHAPTLNPVRIASDVDCLGGSGNGPGYVAGPVYVGGNDPNGLDADGDGWGCE